MKSFLFALAAVLVNAAVRRGAPDHAPGTIRDTFVVEFEQGVDALKAVSDHFKKHDISEYNIRTHVTTAHANFVSFSVSGGKYDEVQHLAGIPRSTYYSTIRTRNRPVTASTPMEWEWTSATTETSELIHNMTKVNEARKLGYTGKGIKVAIIDDGIYYLHPALGGGFGKGHKVSFGRDLVGDEYDGTAQSLKPDADPLDLCSENSHGTHVAGIVAADTSRYQSWSSKYYPETKFSGVAPDVQLGGYRVFSCSGATSTDIIASAVFLAAHDGADVLNLSLGGGPGFNDEIDALAIETVAKAGFHVSVSSGNEGAAGAFVASDPSISTGAIGVASIDNVEAPAPYLTVDNVAFPYSMGSANSSFSESEYLEVVVNDLTAEARNADDDGCNEIPLVNARGKALLIRWGNPSSGGSGVRCDYAFRAGAKACILYGNDETINPIYGSKHIPSLFASRAAGLAIIKAVNSGSSPKLVVTKKSRVFSNPTGGYLSAFSSPGLDSELFMKPDIAGVGGRVLSTISPLAAEKQNLSSPYGVYDGTSMSSPYVAGVMALILQARGKMGYAEMKAYLQNGANPVNVLKSKDLHSPAYQGAGLVNALASTTLQTVVIPSSFALNDTINRKKVETFTIFNKHKKTVKYTIKYTSSVTVNPFVEGDDIVQTAAATTFSSDNQAEILFQASGNGQLDTIVPAGKSKAVTFMVRPPNADSDAYPIFGGYITIENDQDDTVVRVPYAGIVGDWSNRPIWSQDSPSLLKTWFQPLVKNVFNSTTVPETCATGIYNGISFTPVKNNDIVKVSNGVFVIAPAASTSRIALVLVRPVGNATLFTKMLDEVGITGEAVIMLADIQVSMLGPAVWSPLRRNTVYKGQSATTPGVFVWDGSAISETRSARVNLPPGEYQLLFVAMGNFGAGKDGKYHVVETPVFNLEY